MDRISTWRSIRFEVELDLGGRITSDSRTRDIFVRQYGFGALVEGCRRIKRICLQASNIKSEQPREVVTGNPLSFEPGPKSIHIILNG